MCVGHLVSVRIRIGLRSGSVSGSVMCVRHLDTSNFIPRRLCLYVLADAQIRALCVVGNARTQRSRQQLLGGNAGR